MEEVERRAAPAAARIPPGAGAGGVRSRPPRPRPKPGPIGRPEKKRPTAYAERLKWLRKFPNANANATAKRRPPRPAAAARRPAPLANGDREPSRERDAPGAAAPAADPPAEADDARAPSLDAGRPSITFKCRKCGRTSFESLETLKEHQSNCASGPSAEPGGAGGRASRQVVLCSACGIYFENWNLFLHMRDVHARHICLYCVGLFSRADKLASHLVSKHGVRPESFASEAELAERHPDAFHLMCCRCELAFARRDRFATHECVPPAGRRPSRDVDGERPKARRGADANANARTKRIPAAGRGPSPDAGRPAPAAPSPVRDAEGAPPERAEASPSALAANATPPADDRSREPAAGPVAGSPDRTENENESENADADDPRPEATLANDDAVRTGGESEPEPEPEPASPRPASETREIEPRPEAEDPPAELANGPGSGDDRLVPKLTVKVPRAAPEREPSESEDGEPEADADADPDRPPDGAAAAAADPRAAAESETPGEDVPIIELTLDGPLDRTPTGELLRALLRASFRSCIYCNHARRIAVDGRRLGLHFISQHRFAATVNSITAEELLPETIVSRIRAGLADVEREHVNLDEEGAPERKYECLQCHYETAAHKDLYFHNRKMHQKTILLCVMCKSNFYSYGELMCHLCPGVYALDGETASFRCCVCRLEPIPSAFRLMVHLRKRHDACDVCLEICGDQSRLSSHVRKHKLHHLCYRCGISYRNKPDITDHLFWKHGTESVPCKRCLQRKWPHVYHFCVPPELFACEECGSSFSSAARLRVHRRVHDGEYPYGCEEPDCPERFISKRLLSKHRAKHENERALENGKPPEEPAEAPPADPLDPVAPAAVADGVRSGGRSGKRGASLKDSLLMDVNLPALNLSESGSSDCSDSETERRPDPRDGDARPAEDAPRGAEVPEEAKPEPPVQGVWDDFELYRQSLERRTERPHVPTHVCESDHDYCVVPTDDSPDVEIVGEIEPKIERIVVRDGPPKRAKSAKRRNGSDAAASSSSDSSGDSDSSCSCGTNCSCSSTGGSSSSGSSSDSSSGTPRRRREGDRKDSDASAVEVVATGGSPAPVPRPNEPAFAESDLDSDESATDEDFYDEHPERTANRLLAEKRNRLIQSASASPANDAPRFDAPDGRPPTPDAASAATARRKIKTKKRKKEKRTRPDPERAEVPASPDAPVDSRDKLANKITISLQSNTVQVRDSTVPPDAADPAIAFAPPDADGKRASKRRRVPNKFYGYSSDEELATKPPQPPRFEWRKEDLPATSDSRPEDFQPKKTTVEPPLPLSLPLPLALPLPLPFEIPTPAAAPPEPAVPPKSPPKESSGDDSDSSKEGVLRITDPYSPSERRTIGGVKRANPIIDSDIPFPRPTGAREAREGESVYCYCRCPYDEVSEMIACDAEGCIIEWFHFECVGIMVPPKGKWFCPDCRVKQMSALDR